MVKYICDKCKKEQRTYQKTNNLVGHRVIPMYELKLIKIEGGYNSDEIDGMILCKDCVYKLFNEIKEE